MIARISLILLGAALVLAAVVGGNSVAAAEWEDDRHVQLSVRERPTQIKRSECFITVLNVVHRVFREAETRYHIFRPISNCEYVAPHQVLITHSGGAKTLQHFSGVVEEIVVNP